MLKKQFRIIVAALFLAGFLLVPRIAHAQDPTPQPGTIECEGCHEGLRDYWHAGSHADAYADPLFQEAWVAADKDPECLACHTTGFEAGSGSFVIEGVACTVCHGPVPLGHPDNMMPTDVSATACGSCHIDTYATFQTSAHNEEEMACSTCHNPHTNELRVGDTQALCNSCHEDEGTFFAMTSHAEQGLLCTDCHLRVETNAAGLGEGHAMREHSFEVTLATCNECHEAEMHAAADTVDKGPLGDTVCYRLDTAANGSGGTAETLGLFAAPASLNPLAFILPAAFALIFGIMLAPLFENVARRRLGKG